MRYHTNCCIHVIYIWILCLTVGLGSAVDLNFYNKKNTKSVSRKVPCKSITPSTDTKIGIIPTNHTKIIPHHHFTNPISAGRIRIFQSFQNSWTGWIQSHKDGIFDPSDFTDMVSYSKVTRTTPCTINTTMMATTASTSALSHPSHGNDRMDSFTNILTWTSLYIVGIQSIQTVWVDQNLSLFEVRCLT